MSAKFYNMNAFTMNVFAMNVFAMNAFDMNAFAMNAFAMNALKVSLSVRYDYDSLSTKHFSPHLIIAITQFYKNNFLADVFVSIVFI